MKFWNIGRRNISRFGQKLVVYPKIKMFSNWNFFFDIDSNHVHASKISNGPRKKSNKRHANLDNKCHQNAKSVKRVSCEVRVIRHWIW